MRCDGQALACRTGRLQLRWDKKGPMRGESEVAGAKAMPVSGLDHWTLRVFPPCAPPSSLSVVSHISTSEIFALTLS